MPVSVTRHRHQRARRGQLRPAEHHGEHHGEHVYQTVAVIDDGAGSPDWTTTGTWTNWTGQGYDGDVHQATPVTSDQPCGDGHLDVQRSDSGPVLQGGNDLDEEREPGHQRPVHDQRRSVDFDSAGYGQPATSRRSECDSTDNWTWQELGVYESTTTGELVVTLSNCGANGNVIADAVRIEPVPSQRTVDHGAGGDGRCERPGGAPHALGQRADDRELRRRSLRAPWRGRPLRCSMAAADASCPTTCRRAGGLHACIPALARRRWPPAVPRTFVLQENTSAVGTNSGTVTFTTNDSAENDSFSFPVTGTVLNVAPTATISASSSPVY